MQPQTHHAHSQVSQVNALVMFRMAWPIALGFVGIMLMGTVDLICVGRLGALELAAVGLGNIFWALCYMPGIGVTMGVEFPVAFNFGARRHSECRRVLIQGFWIVTAYSLLAVLLPQPFMGFLRGLAADPEQGRLAVQYFEVTLWSIWPTLIFMATRIYLQALGSVTPAFVILIVANVLNLFLDLVFILGWFGFPQWGVYGAAFATNISRCFMMSAALGYVLWADKRLWVLVRNLKIKPSKSKLREILKLGIPSGLQVSFEGGVFSVSTILASTFDMVSSAAHQTVLNLASNTFMIPLGISSAASVLVGQSLGRRNMTDLRKAGRLGFQIAAVWMLGTSFLFLAFPEFFIGIYTTDKAVIQAGAQLMLVAAAFQISDGIQVVGTGVLRGLGDTKSSMVVNLIGHWAIGFPLGLLLGYTLDLKVQGIWIGLATGLLAVATVLVVIWIKKLRSLR